jgi:hypothetical protein
MTRAYKRNDLAYLSRLAKLTRDTQRSRQPLPLALAGSISSIDIRRVIIAAPCFFVPVLGGVAWRIVGLVLVGVHRCRRGRREPEQAGNRSYVPKDRAATPPHAPSFRRRTILPRRPAACERTILTTEQLISVFDGWPAWRVGRKVYLVDCFLCCSFLASLTISIAITCPLGRIIPLHLS